MALLHPVTLPPWELFELLFTHLEHLLEIPRGQVLFSLSRDDIGQCPPNLAVRQLCQRVANYGGMLRSTGYLLGCCYIFVFVC